MADVVLVESFYGGSHRSWVDGWIAHSSHDVGLISLPGEFWRWRLRGAAVTLAERFDAYVSDRGRPDAVVVSGMVDAAAFVGIARRALGGVPVALYMHESQLLYPVAPNQRRDTSLALTNWQSMVGVDQVWFNSHFHRTELRRAAAAFLQTQPEPGHGHLVDAIFDRSCVLYPGVAAKRLVLGERCAAGDGVPLVLWNQRWDHDKNPHAVFGALARLAEEGVAFRLALAGQNLRSADSDFPDLMRRLAGRIEHFGFLPDEEYHDLLLRSDVVASAAAHEFFGIAIVEAIAAGAVPVLPDRLSFPELVGSQWKAASIYPDGGLRERLRAVLVDLDAARESVDGLRQSMERFDHTHSAVAHDRAVDELIVLASRDG